MHNRPQQRVHYDTQYPHHQEQHQQERKSRVTSPSAAEAKPSATGVYKQGNVQTGPSQSVLLSTQAQLERLKNEVTQLDELVNRLKAQHVTLDQAEALNMNIGSTADVGEERQGQDGYDHYNNHNAHESSNKTNAGSRQAEESDTRNNERTKKEKILEFENSIASQNDILNLIRYLDSLIWMRSSASSPSFKLYNQDEDGNINKREESRRRNSRINGKGIRNDNVIFARGNLDHLAKRITAWENIVRSKEEEVKYDFITR